MARFDPTQVPEDLSGMTDKELDELAGQVAEAIDSLAAELPADGRLTDEHDQALNDIEALDAAGQRIAGEISGRDELSDARRQRLDAVLGRSAEVEPEGEGEGETGDGAPAEGAPEGAPAVAAATTADPPAELVVDPAPVAPTTAAARTRPRGGTLAQLRERRPAAARPKATRSGAFMQATANVLGMPAGAPMEDPLEVARAIVKKRQQFGHIPDGIHQEYVSIATGQKEIPDEFTLGADAEQNFEVLQSLRKDHGALVASAACCAPLTPMYDFFRLAEVQSPIEDCLPTVAAPRGGIRFIPGTCDLAEAIAGIGTQCCDPTGQAPPPPPKPCTTVACPTLEDVTVCAVSQCVTFGNLQYRTFPEQVQAFLEDVAVAFTQAKEASYLASIVAASTAATANTPYGSSRGLLYDLTRAAVAYRKRHLMKRGSMLQVLLPDWAIDLIKVDMVMDAEGGYAAWGVSDSDVISGIRGIGLDPCWYNDTTGFGPQAAGALNNFPAVVNWFLYAPGSFVRLDGGTLDVGLVRDSTLNRSNDLQMFMEEWVAIANMGCESVAGQSTTCPNGARPDYVAPFACA